MRAVIQRVSQASVEFTSAGTGAKPALAGSSAATVRSIAPGLLVLLGVAPLDTDGDARWLAEKIAKLRIFPDAEGHMNLSILDLAPSPVSGLADPSSLPLAPSVLVVSQFTLFASTRKGTRPSFNDAAKPDVAIPLYESFCRILSAALGRPVATGEFGAHMAVSLVNDGPVTLIIDSHQRE